MPEHLSARLNRSAPLNDDALQAAISAIDSANGEDPNVIVFEGRSWPRAQLQGVRATYWLGELDTSADPAVTIAARAHHLRRWSVNRSSFPEGRAGYHRWKREARAAHRAAIEAVLAPLQLPSDVVARAGEFAERTSLTEPGTQLVEDVACLVFLETQYDELIERLGDEKVSDALRKTTRKMSAAAIALSPRAVASGRGRTAAAHRAAAHGEPGASGFGLDSQ